MPAIPTFPKGYTKQWKQNQQRRIAETKYIYYTVPANPAESKEDYQEIISKLLNYLEIGWKIYSATGVQGGVHYILVKQESKQ